MAWIREDPTIVGMLAYTWEGSWSVHRQDNFMSLGVPDFADVMAELRAIGRSIVDET